MSLSLTEKRLLDGCREYRATLEEREPLELNVENRWDEEQEMLQRFPDRFQEAGRIDRIDDFKLLTRWKWPGLWSNYARANSPERLERVTATAFEWRERQSAEPSKTVIRDQIGVLTCLDGVRPAMASVVLTFWRPEEYTVVDERALTALSRATDESYRWTAATDASRKWYPAYVAVCKRIRDDFDGKFSLRDIDRALWVLGGDE